MNNFQLYYLCEPDTDEVRYVGITKNGLKKRLSQHLKNPTNYFISKWFKELNINNKKPVIKLIKECETYEELLQSEINEIKKFRGFKTYKDKSNIYNLNKDNIITYLNSGLNYIQIGNKHWCSNKIIHKFIKKHKLYVK